MTRWWLSKGKLLGEEEINTNYRQSITRITFTLSYSFTFPCLFPHVYFVITLLLDFFSSPFSNILLKSFFIVIDFRPVCFRLFGLKIHLVCLTSFKKHFDRKPQKQKCQMQNILRVEPEIAPTFMRRIKLHNKCL